VKTDKFIPAFVADVTRTWRCWVPFGFLGVIALIIFWPILFGQSTLYPIDITNELFLPFAAGKASTDVQVTSLSDYVLGYYPMRWFQAKAFRSGQLNLWNPYVFGGYPAFASTGSVVSLDPFNVFLLLPDLGSALAWRTFLQVMTCSIFMYLYLRHLLLGPTASLVGSMGFSLNSMFWVNIFDWSLEGMLWLPIVLLLLERALLRRSLRVAIAAGLVLGTALLASPLQIYFYICFAIAALLGLRWLILHRNVQHLKVYFGLGLATLIIGIALSSIQLLPTLELLEHSPRMEGMAFSAKHPRTPLQMIFATGALSSFVFPNLVGRVKDSMMISGSLWGGETHWQGFIGIVPFILAAIGAFASKDPRRKPFIALALLVLAIVLYTPLVLFVYERFFLVYIFCASVLAAMGYQAISKNRLDSHRAHLSIRLIGTLFILVAACLAALNVAFAIAGAKLTDRVLTSVKHTLATRYLGIANPNLYLQKAHNLLNDFHLTSIHTALPLLIAFLGLGIIVLQIRGSVKSACFAIFIVGLTAFDLGFMTISHVPLVDLKKYRFSPSAPAINLIMADPGVYRVVSFHSQSEPPVLPAGTMSVYGIQSANGYDNLCPPHVGRLLSFKCQPGPRGFNMTPNRSDLANVKYIVTGPFAELPHPRFQLLYDKDVRVYRDQEVLPRAFLVGAYEVVPGWISALARARSLDFDPRTTVILDVPPQIPPSNICTRSAKVEILDYQASEVRIKTHSSASGLLVLSDTYYPGWKATVDGQSVPIIRANGVMRAVALGAGDHTVLFKYAPESLKTGKLISSVTLLLSVLLLIMLTRKRNKQVQHDQVST
jgi:hypothetical protein